MQKGLANSFSIFFKWMDICIKKRYNKQSKTHSRFCCVKGIPIFEKSGLTDIGCVAYAKSERKKAMPSTYAHYRLGQQIRKELTGEIRRIIDENLDLYLIGVHGPDLLFYYNPLIHTKVSELGHEIHRSAGSYFFQKARSVIEQTTSLKEKEAHLAYAYGVLIHFSMDVTCHHTVFAAQRGGGLSHTEIESEFDRALLLHDGKPTFKQNLVKHIKVSKENAEVIKNFYRGVSKGQIVSSMRGMILAHDLFLAPNPYKRFIIFSGMKLIGAYHGLHGCVMNYQENPLYAKTTKELLRLYPKAKQVGRALIKEYASYLAHEGELSDLFLYDFSSGYHGEIEIRS